MIIVKMGVIPKRATSIFAVLTVLFASISLSASLAVMSIDLGNEYIKIAIVKPGVPMETVLNEESQRKTPLIVAMRDGERFFGNAAMSTATRFPKKAFWYLLDLIGKKMDDPQVELYQKRFPYYTLVPDEDRGTVLFETTEDSRFSPEELLAMVLEKARIYAEAFADQTIKDCVITIPVFFNQVERHAVLQAAEMVGLNVLQLMSNNAAVALNYGVFRRKNFNATTQYYMFYDMGASSTVASVVGYQEAKIKDGTRMDNNPQLVIKGVGFDRTLGGQEMTIRLRDHLAKQFNAQKKTKTDVFTNNRSMGKLYKEAERVKKVLSANVQHMAQIEGLLEEIDCKIKVTREEIEEMNRDLYERITKPIEDALKSSEITLPEITEVILMGAGTRTPKVQEVLQEYLGGRDLGKSINTDEAAALGAVYQAAYLGKGFKVKTFGVKEASIYPIVVEFDKQKTEEDGTETTRTVKRTLFGRMNPFPQKKVMTFNKHYKDFSVNVSYGDLDFLEPQYLKAFESRVLQKVDLTGVEEAYGKHGETAESKGVKAHFRMDESGILHLDHVEYVFEKQEDEEQTDQKSTWSKLGESISGLFGTQENLDETVESSEYTEDKNTGSPDDKTESKPEQTSSDTAKPDETGSDMPDADEPDQPKPDSDQENEDPAQKPDEKPESDEKGPSKEENGENSENANDEEKDKKDADKSESKKSEEQNDKKGDAEKKDASENKDEKDEKKEKKDEEPPKPKQVTIKENITAQVIRMGLPELSDRRMVQSKKRLSELTSIDKEKKLLDQAKNELESFIYDMSDKLTLKDYVACSTDEERESLSQKLAEASDWQYEQEDDAKKEEFINKLDYLRKEINDLQFRVKERSERPRALDALKSMLNQSEYFLKTIYNITDVEDPMFTEVEIKMLEKLINETYEWRESMLKEQDQTPGHEKPKLLVEDIAYKLSALDREVKYLINKAKNFRPRLKTKVNATEGNDTVIPKDTKSKNETKDSADTSSDPTDDKVETDQDMDTDSTDEQTPQLELPETQTVDDHSSDSKSEESPEEIQQLDAEEKSELKKSEENHDPQEL